MRPGALAALVELEISTSTDLRIQLAEILILHTRLSKDQAGLSEVTIELFVYFKELLKHGALVALCLPCEVILHDLVSLTLTRDDLFKISNLFFLLQNQGVLGFQFLSKLLIDCND